MFGWSSLLQAQVQFAPSGLSLAEYEAVDNCALKVTYALRIVPDHRQKDYVYEDIQVLEVGTEVVKSYSYVLFLSCKRRYYRWMSTAMRKSNR